LVAAAAPLRLAPDTYIAHTQPGLEGVVWDEISARSGVDGARELGRRVIPDRAGMCVFRARQTEPLRHLRTAEDLFYLVGYKRGLAGDSDAREHIRAMAREAPFVDRALDTMVNVRPGSRSGRRLRFRVVARMAGEHDFRRIDFKRAVEQGIAERGDHSWRLTEGDADVEIWATMLANDAMLALRLSDERMRHREYKVAHAPGSLRPSVAAAMAWLSRPADEDIVLDPMCGTGTILIERALIGRYAKLIGSDRDAAMLEAARENIGPRYKPIELHPWDAAAIPLPDGSVSRVITNLPWGIRHGSHEENRRLYPRLLVEFQRLVRKDGAIVILTGETRLMNNVSARAGFRPEKILRVSILGARAAIYVWRV
jgi:tRNA (guanine6-N2)-methyltransferase